MFRSKKGAPPIIDQAGQDRIDRVEAEDGEVERAAPRRPLPAPVRAYAASAPSYEVSRRGFELPPAVGRGTAAAGAVREKTLTVGRDVQLRGEIIACERLVVEGRVDITVHSCHHVQVGESGVFRGTFDVAEAEIAGDLEGEITVRERLTVRASGKIRGRIRYRHIVIEAGGLIIGDVGELDNGNKMRGKPTEDDARTTVYGESQPGSGHKPPLEAETMIAPID